MSRIPGWLRPIARPLLPGWPDAGRRIVQTPALEELLREVTRRGRTPAVLNAGCGEGLFAPLLLARCGPSLQIELDLSVAGARHLCSERQQYISGSLTALPLRDASIDLVLCSEVLEHIPEDGVAVAELARVLKPHGWLLVSVPTPPAVPDPNHVREGYTAPELERLLRAHGLDPVEWRMCMRLFFRSVLRWWRPGFVARFVITGLAYLDRLVPIGPPMDLIVLAQKTGR